MPSLPPSLKDWLRLLGQEWSENTNEPLSPEARAATVALIRSYVAAEPKVRGRIRASVTNRVLGNLLRFIHRIAEESVRTLNPDLLKEGFILLALGSDHLDPRDVITAFSLLAHSAQKMKRDFKPLFEDAAELAGEEYKEEIRD